MRGRAPLRAEVFARLDEAAAEQLLPGAVDRDARRQRVLLVDEPARQAKAVRHLVVAERRQEVGHAGIHLLTLVEEAPAAAHVRRRPLVGDPLAHHERRRDGERLERLLQLGDPIARRLQRRRDGPVERREILALLLGAIRRGDRQDGPQPRRDFDDALPECSRT